MKKNGSVVLKIADGIFLIHMKIGRFMLLLLISGTHFLHIFIFVIHWTLSREL